MKRDVFWTVGGVVSALAVMVFLGSSGTAPDPKVSASVMTSVAGNADRGHGALSASPSTTRIAAARAPIHWSTAPYSTSSDLFAAVFQPKGMTASDAFSAFESLSGDADLRGAASKIEWIAAYGPSLSSELDMASKLTLVIHEAAPTTATEVAAARFTGREQSEYTLGEWVGVLVGAGAESIQMERADASGEYRKVESTIEHEAVVVIEHDPQTYVIVAERRAEEVLRQQPSTALAARLASLDSHAACGFVTAEGQTGIVSILARTGGDRTAAVLQPAVELFKNASAVSLTASLEGADLFHAEVGFVDATEAARVVGALGELKAKAVASLASEGSGPLLQTGRRLLESITTSIEGTTLQIRLPRPTNLAALLTPERLSTSR